MITLWEPHAPQAAALPESIELDGLALNVYGGVACSRRIAPGVMEIDITGDADVRLEWRLPCTDAAAYWTPGGSSSRWLPAAWAKPQSSTLANGSTVGSLIGSGDSAICTFAAAQTIALASAGVAEESGEFRFWVQARGRLRVRIDLSARHYSQTLADVASWWSGGVAQHVPDAARMPAYSTWYSMHQNISPAAVETQSALAKDLGCDVIIVDDGWMTADRTRGYGHCGDWEPLSLPETGKHVQRVHDQGMAYMLWYALPFIGWDSAVWDRFKPYALRNLEHMQAIVVDPRYPAVREYLVGRLARAVEEWGMDGLKIDFVDWFAAPDAPAPGPEADCVEVADGVERLLAAIHGRITAANPEAMVEHRQPYVSHGLWPYASMIRATDCPLSPAENRQRTVDLRLTSGPLAVHADMLMWHPSETPEQVGVHLINVLFSVPQISVDLTTQTPEQLEALRFWLGQFRSHRDVLQLGRFQPARPELGYPLVRASRGETVVVARYAPLPVEVPATGWTRFLVANADHDTRVVLVGDIQGQVDATVQDAQGRTVSSGMVSFELSITEVCVPTGGLLTLVNRTSEGE